MHNIILVIMWQKVYVRNQGIIRACESESRETSHRKHLFSRSGCWDGKLPKKLQKLQHPRCLILHRKKIKLMVCNNNDDDDYVENTLYTMHVHDNKK